MIYLLAFILLHPLFVLLFIGWAKTGWKVFAAPGLVLDVLINFTTVSLFLGWPERGEWTISKRLKRQRFEMGRRGSFAWVLANVANSIKPNHI